MSARRRSIPALPWLLGVTALLLLPGVVGAHVGSPDVFFEGMAGSYPVRVVIRTPAVVPGLAEISVRTSAPAESVAIRLFRWDAGEEGAPPAEDATPVPGDADLYASELWLMTAGAHSVEVTVSGPQGEGTALVPFESIRRATLEMETGYAAMLVAMGLFLFIGAATILGASVRESTLAPGESIDGRRARRGRVATIAGAVILGVLLWGGWNWWADVDAAYRGAVYQPLPTAASATVIDGARILDLSITDQRWIDGGWTPLAPDHGKLMHMFLVRDDLTAFAHVHPLRVDHETFRLRVPPLPAGRYRIYGDIVHESGFSQTLVNEVNLPAAPAQPTAADTPEGVETAGESGEGFPAADPDDSWAAGAGSGTRFALSDGGTLEWVPPAEPIVAGADLTLEFRAYDEDGTPSRLETYMGMLSHSAITRADGEVFVHLHPSGSISMGALRLAAEKRNLSAAHDAHAGDGRVAFPYAFPRSGTYRMWVQIKRGGRVETGNFEIEVL